MYPCMCPDLLAQLLQGTIAGKLGPRYLVSVVWGEYLQSGELNTVFLNNVAEAQAKIIELANHKPENLWPKIWDWRENILGLFPFVTFKCPRQ